MSKRKAKELVRVEWYDKRDWTQAAEVAGYSISWLWGAGDAFDAEGNKVGSWEGDHWTPNFVRPYGWLMQRKI